MVEYTAEEAGDKLLTVQQRPVQLSSQPSPHSRNTTQPSPHLRNTTQHHSLNITPRPSSTSACSSSSSKHLVANMQCPTSGPKRLSASNTSIGDSHRQSLTSLHAAAKNKPSNESGSISLQPNMQGNSIIISHNNKSIGTQCPPDASLLSSALNGHFEGSNYEENINTIDAYNLNVINNPCVEHTSTYEEAYSGPSNVEFLNGTLTDNLDNPALLSETAAEGKPTAPQSLPHMTQLQLQQHLQMRAMQEDSSLQFSAAHTNGKFRLFSCINASKKTLFFVNYTTIIFCQL